MRYRSPWGLALLLAVACGNDTPMRMPPPAAPLGGLEVRWTLEDPDGTALDCRDLGIVKTTVAIGATPVDVACEDEPVARFADILPGRVPIIIRHENPIGLVLFEHIDNIDIVANMTTAYTHTFEIDENQIDNGQIEFRWAIDGLAAALRCGTVGGDQVRITALPASIDDLELTAPCADGVVVVDDARRGGYDFLLTLLDADGETIARRSAGDIAVIASERTVVSISFSTLEPTPTRLHTTWTITGSAAPDGCVAVNGERVEVTLFAIRILNGVFQEVATATATCDAGQLTMLDLQTGFEHRTITRLFDTFERVIADETVDEVPLETGSATVTIDFTVFD